MTEILIAVFVFLLGTSFGHWMRGRRIPDDNLYRWDMAQHLYGKDAAKKIMECDDAHLFGDCPLCGARQ